MSTPQDAGVPDHVVKEATDLSVYDRKRIALILSTGAGSSVLTGVASHTRDSRLGRVLRITPDKLGTGMPVFVIAESDWRGKVTRDSRFGCDFCFDTRVR